MSLCICCRLRSTAFLWTREGQYPSSAGTPIFVVLPSARYTDYISCNLHALFSFPIFLSSSFLSIPFPSTFPFPFFENLFKPQLTMIFSILMYSINSICKSILMNVFFRMIPWNQEIKIKKEEGINVWENVVLVILCTLYTDFYWIHIQVQCTLSC